ncbi:elongation of very long chain fatty acids protein 4-like [Hyposmocoma kahamanoa]|uniref:elongation of very long chain fatty acids protein 4-like n=1 Tax=Hyposmocoma kahamanoa TaxID=1477025 RepID=UPI000E6D7EE2|nr:elongation of very long chain fatty acids protein 4-like [Hyposmocoma kahamanoa]XP_026328691.1 elongation of very long chain fatty acids protein 4-like [Hyposmocoma kahamanoa]XP_026328692.1 elongation of very long chain fatty acids protein 4-like [Hyposmocoma kahamanoa]
MAAVFGVKSPMWDLNKSQYDEIDDLPLMSTPGVIMMILATYLLFVLKIGPDFMRKREAFKLTKVLIVYNAVQVVASAFLVQYYLRSLLRTGLTPQKCYMGEESYRKEILLGIWFYLAAKVTELLDTIFFVLRKKNNQITFLHLYHHSIMMVGTWALLKYCPSQNLFFIGFINSLVHIFMYTYYGLAALGPNVAKYLTWKKHMTKFQLIQFVSIIVQYVISTRISDCPPTKGTAIFVASNTFVFLLLFLNFYRQKYIQKKPKTN